MRTRFHWDEDRDFGLIEEYIYDRAEDGDDYVVEAMKYWMGVPEATLVNRANVLKAYESMERTDRRAVLEGYIEEMGDTYGFDDWYRERENIDPVTDHAKNAGDGIEDDMYLDDWQHCAKLPGDGRF